MNFSQMILKVAIYWGASCLLGAIIIQFAITDADWRQMVMIVWLSSTLICALIGAAEDLHPTNSEAESN